MNTDRVCWTCDFQKIGGHLTFLGFCKWFFVMKGQPEKAIPPAVVDVGCKFWTTRQAKGDSDERTGEASGESDA